MRKIAVFLILLISISAFFSCDFQIPSAVEVFGNPKLKFSAKTDIGEMLQDKLEDNNDYDIISCTNTDARTYILIQSIIIDSTLASHKSGLGFTGEGNVPAPILLATDQAEISVDFSDVLHYFELNPVKARLYIYGSGLNDVVEVDINGSNFIFNKQTVNFTNKEYSGTSLPGSSNGANGEIEIPLGKNPTTIDYTVTIPAGKPVNSAWFDIPLYADILIWLPLEFTATSDDAQIVFPDDFLFSGGDLFGREKQDDSNPLEDYVESLELSINLKQNAFKDRELIIWSGQKPYTNPGNIVIRHTLTGNALVIPIDNETMKKINDPANFPFSPNFLFEYKEDEELIIPKEFVSTEFVFKAKVNYRKEF